MSNLDIYFLIENFRRITEQTSIQVFEYFGKDNKHIADEVAVNTMRNELTQLPFLNRIIIGEGEKDNAPMLYEGEILGSGSLELDLAVDPLECTTNFSKGLPNSMSIIAFSAKDCMVKVPGTYMEQWLSGPGMKEEFSPEDALSVNIEKLSDSYKKLKKDLIIVVQERPRHEKLIQDLRALGCSITLIDSGSITAALDICMEFGHYDAMIGTYGAPEGLITAIIARLTGSEMKAVMRPHQEIFKERWESQGFSDNQILDKSDLVWGDILGVSATCISTNLFMKGLKKVSKKFTGQTMTLSPKGFDIHEFTILE
jgi:fructose-1,6-bisphosphatase II